MPFTSPNLNMLSRPFSFSSEQLTASTKGGAASLQMSFWTSLVRHGRWELVTCEYIDQTAAIEAKLPSASRPVSSSVGNFGERSSLARSARRRDSGVDYNVPGDQGLLPGIKSLQFVPNTSLDLFRLPFQEFIMHTHGTVGLEVRSALSFLGSHLNFTYSLTCHVLHKASNRTYGSSAHHPCTAYQ